MDITSAIASQSMALSQAKTDSSVALKLLAGQIDAASRQGAQIADMLGSTPNPGELGGLLDIRA